MPLAKADWSSKWLTRTKPRRLRKRLPPLPLRKRPPLQKRLLLRQWRLPKLQFLLRQPPKRLRPRARIVVPRGVAVVAVVVPAVAAAAVAAIAAAEVVVTIAVAARRAMTAARN